MDYTAYTLFHNSGKQNAPRAMPLSSDEVLAHFDSSTSGLRQHAKDIMLCNVQIVTQCYIMYGCARQSTCQATRQFLPAPQHCSAHSVSHS